MLWLIERGFSGPGWRRALLLAVISSLVMLTAWFFLIRPQNALLLQLRMQSEQAGQRLAELRHKIRELPQPETAVLSPHPPVFSVTEFVSQSNGQLLKWQPEDKQGVLEILVPWENLPGLFARLAEYRAVASHSFTLTAQGALLHLALAMEFADES